MHRRSLFTIYVFRYEDVSIQPLLQAISTIEGKTRYQRPAHREDAPQVTDCLTLIWYLFKTALRVDLSIVYIGNMPRQLFSLSSWRVIQIDIKDARCGDLLFVKNRDQERLLSHVAMCLGNGRFFHASSYLGTAINESAEEFFTQYEQKLGFTKMLGYIDSRDEELIEAQGGAFMH